MSSILEIVLANIAYMCEGIELIKTSLPMEKKKVGIRKNFILKI